VSPRGIEAGMTALQAILMIIAPPIPTGIIRNISSIYRVTLTIIDRLTRELFQLTWVLFRLTGVLFRLTGVLFRQTRVFFTITGVLFRLTGALFSLNYKNVLTAGQLLYLKPWPAASHLDSSLLIVNYNLNKRNLLCDYENNNNYKLFQKLQ